MAKSSSATEPLTVTMDGRAPERRVTTAAGAWKSYQDAVMTAALDDLRFASIRGIFDGFPPQDPRELQDQGLQDMPNINLRQFSSKVNTYVSTWVDHNCSGDQWYEVKFKRDKFDTVEEWVRANDYGQRCFNDCIKLWDSPDQEDPSWFIFQRVVCDTQMGLFGVGVLQFRDPIDWRPKAVPSRKVLPSRGTKITLENCQALFIENPYTVAGLWKYIKDEETAKQTKWNREPVLQVLYTKTRNTQSGVGGFESMAEWENRIRDNDTFLQYDFRLIDLVDCYFQEFDTSQNGDGITHCVVLKDGTSSTDFLYENEREVKRWREIIIPFCDSAGPEGDWHGVKGFGDLIFDGCHQNNLFYNFLSRMAIISGLPNFQSASESDREKLKQIVFTPLGILFPDVQLQELKINADFTGGLAILAESNRVINTNTRIFPQNDQAGGEQPTATQVTFDRQDQAAFTSLQIKFYRITGADPLGSEMYRRISRSAEDYPESWPGGPAAKEFRKRMKKYGITESQYQTPQYVRAHRGGGTGNMALDLQKAKEVLQVATPGRGQENARKEVVRAIQGQDRVEEFLEFDQPPTPEDVVIGLENTTLQNAQMINAFPFQPHERHLGDPTPDGEGHLAVVASALEAARQIDAQGIETALQDAIKLEKVLEASLTHSAQHTKFLGELPSNEQIFKDLSKVLVEARGFNQNFAKSIEAAVQKQQQEQQPQQQDPKVQAIMMKAQAEIESLKAKTAAEIQISGVKQQQKLSNMQMTADARRAEREQKASLEMGIQAEQSLIDQQRQAIDLQNEVKKGEAKTRAKKNTKTE